MFPSNEVKANPKHLKKLVADLKLKVVDIEILIHKMAMDDQWLMDHDWVDSKMA